MNNRSKAEQKYWDALKRLITRESNVVDTNDATFRFSNLSVAVEAGKKNPKGYIRPQRYPDLCDAIKLAETKRLASFDSQTVNDNKDGEKKDRETDAKYKVLRGDYEKLLEQYVNVVKENLELKVHIANQKSARNLYNQ